MDGNAAAVLTKPAFRKIEWLKRDIAVERRPDGVIVLKSRIPLKPYEKHIPASLAKWAAERPERIWLALLLPTGFWGIVRLAEAGHSCIVVSKGTLASGSTLWAQGGISAVLDEEDSLEAHVRDTLIAGGGLCEERAVRFTVGRGPDCIRWLVEQGVVFTQEDGELRGQRLHLTREGGHSHRRVVHAADATGRAVETTLAALAAGHPNISVREQSVAVDLVVDRAARRVLGAYLLHRPSGRISALPAKAVSVILVNWVALVTVMSSRK